MTENFINSPLKHPWWSPFLNIGPPPRTLDEWSVIAIINEIKQKDNWQEKLANEEITNKWKQEIKEQLTSTFTSADDLIKIVFAELQWIKKSNEEIAPFSISIEDKIVVADKVISSVDKASFVEQVNALKLSFSELDYHPNSQNQVIDLVHPSLYPLQYGVTPVLDKDGTLAISKFDEKYVVAKKNVNYWGISQDFQWLPSVFKFDPSTKKFTIASYINNLHPIKFKSLYTSIESIFNKVVPGLNFALSRQASKDYLRIKWKDFDYTTQEFRDMESKIWDNWEKDNSSNADEEYEKLQEKKMDYLIPPTLNFDGPETDKSIDLTTFEDGIKVIVKLADIELTPENPKYNGGSWHVEGTINEDIVATVIYYYDVENITDSSLSFRSGFEDPNYEQGDTIFCEKIYGLHDEEQMVKTLGSVKTTQDRVLIFPNVFQHHVDSFELKDQTKPGRRRILALFIVDPHNDRVVATDRVPPQQKEWWDENNEEVISKATKEAITKLNSSLPQSLDLVKKVREKLMEQRSLVKEEEYHEIDMEHPFERHFSLCEH